MEPSISPPESSVSSGIREENLSRPTRQRRTFLTHNACNRCRQKKSKCDGRRPVCGRCEKNTAECVFDVAQEGITRMQNLQQLLSESSERYDHVMILFEAFRTASDDTATNLLARLRLGESITSLVSSLSNLGFPSPSGEMRDGIDTRQRQGSVSTNTWPPSPADLRAWTPWSTRCDPEQQDMLQTSDSRMEIPRPNTSFRSPGFVVPNMRSPDHMDGIDGAGAYSQSYSYGPARGQNPYLGSTQWDHEPVADGVDGVDGVSEPPSPSSEGESSRDSSSAARQQPVYAPPRRPSDRRGVK